MFLHDTVRLKLLPNVCLKLLALSDDWGVVQVESKECVLLLYGLNDAHYLFDCREHARQVHVQ